ncbi:undecaprenyl-phosphate glucose phosphotransferase [Marinobacter salicampi]|uniref:undecaprenyl-phosphate glucose phosphotransferase n=1 Tax=Marinobacter salicampi TaxID=435907 RepID=UPI001A93C94E|nr:undecaprenyl-phosphate glucose phosphotransferase [Marinobacter salicampi]
MGVVKLKAKPPTQDPVADAEKMIHRVPWTARFAPRSSDIENVSPIIGLTKSLIDPVVVAAILFLLAHVREGEVTGFVFCVAVMALLLSGYLLDGSNVFFRGRAPVKDLFYFLLGWALILFTLATIGYISGYAELMDPVLFIQWALLTPVVVLAMHGLIYWVFRRVASNKAAGLTTIIVGANASGQALANQITRQPLSKLQLLGFCDDRSAVRLSVPDSSVLTNLADLPEFVRKHNVARIYITLSMTSQPRTLELLDALKDTTVSIYFVPDMFVFDFIQASFDEVGGIPVISLCESPFQGVSGITKRASDIVLSVAILAFIWPFLLIIALAVKMTSPGPVIFVQRRYGLDGREIKVYKFRSMAVLEDGGSVTQAIRGDSRLTPIGGFLRRTSLDELPQFFNVLQGRMSVVGPRPHASTHNELYRKLIKGYMVRHKVRPGITGWAQVNGARGETDTLEKMERRIEFDLLYLRNWSIWLDLKVIFRTVVIMLGDRSAY